MSVSSFTVLLSPHASSVTSCHMIVIKWAASSPRKSTVHKDPTAIVHIKHRRVGYGTFYAEHEARRIVRRAVDLGITLTRSGLAIASTGD